MSAHDDKGSTQVRVVRGPDGAVSFEVDGDYPRRKRRGVFFTPWPVALRLARAVVGTSEMGDGWWCDPFVGAGVLLEAAAHVLGAGWGSRAAPRRERLGRLCGADIDPDMLSIAHRTLAPGPASEPPAKESTGAGPHLARIDTLLEPVGGDSAWHTHFPDALARGGFDAVITNPPWEKVRVNDREFFGAFLDGFSRLGRAERDRRRGELLAQPRVASAYAAYRARIEALRAAARRDYATTGSGGDLDMYKLAVERSIDLVRPGGVAGLIVPHGLLGDWGARRLRAWLFEQHQPLEITRFETGRHLFPEIHANLGVLLILVRRGRSARGGWVAVSRAVTRREELDGPEMTRVPVAVIEDATEHCAVPLVDSPADLEFLGRCMAHPALGRWPESWFRPRREVDMTTDRHHFCPPGSAVPLVEGKHLGPFEWCATERRWDVESQATAWAGRSRVAWRAVADRAMRRRLVAAWIPPGVALGNSAIFTVVDDPRATERLLWLLAWMNSRVAEAQLRLWCSNNNINIFHVRACRAPRYRAGSDDDEIVSLAAGLVVARATSASATQGPKHLAVRLDSFAACLQAVRRIDEHMRERVRLSAEVWRTSVLDRTAPVSEWWHRPEVSAVGGGPVDDGGTIG